MSIFIFIAILAAEATNDNQPPPGMVHKTTRIKPGEMVPIVPSPAEITRARLADTLGIKQANITISPNGEFIIRIEPKTAAQIVQKKDCCCQHTQQMAEDIRAMREMMSKPYVPPELPKFNDIKLEPAPRLPDFGGLDDKKPGPPKQPRKINAR